MANPPNVPRDDGYIQTAHGRSPGGTPMTTPAANGSAADFFHAISRVIAEAMAGGIRRKAHANLVLSEGDIQQATALEQYARALQDTGRYPAMVWEPVQRAAAMHRAAAALLRESSTTIAQLANTPMGEANGRAPHHDELNRV